MITTCVSIAALFLLIMHNHVVDRHDFKVNGIYYRQVSEYENTVFVTYKGSTPDLYEHEYQNDIVIPKSVRYNGKDYIVAGIDQYAFKNCNKITSITIPGSIWYIGLDAFGGCTNLSEVHISDLAAWCSLAIESVLDCTGSTPLQYADKLYLNGEILTDLVIPQEVTEISSFVFQDCDCLRSVILHEAVTSICKGAFYGCLNLKSVDMSPNISYIGRDAFTGTAWYDNMSDGVVYIGKLLYNFKGEVPYNTHIIVKEGTEAICESAFDCCIGLSSITLPSSLMMIHDCAFNSCENLVSIYSKAIDPPIINRYYNDCQQKSEVVLYVPIGSKEAYQHDSFMDYDLIVEREFS